MKQKGCCLGCMAIFLIVIGGTCGLLYWGAVSMDLLYESPPRDTAAHIGGSPALLVRVDPNSEQVLGLLDEGFEGQLNAFLQPFLPHDLSFALLPHREDGSSGTVFAISLRRMGGLIKLLTDSPEQWRWFQAQEMISAGLESDNLWVVRGSVRSSDSVLGQVAKWWPVETREALELEGGHDIELVLDNRDGKAWLALDPLLVAGKTDEDAIVVIKAPFEPESSASLTGLFRRVRTFRLSADMAEADRIVLTVEAECRDADAAESMLMLLFTIRDSAYRTCVEKDIALEGHFTRNDSAIRGEFTCTGFRKSLIAMMRSQL